MGLLLERIIIKDLRLNRSQSVLFIRIIIIINKMV